jgi:multicomponent Na+:H+ antiporter subunit E
VSDRRAGQPNLNPAGLERAPLVRRLVAFGAVFFTMLAAWVVLSGRFDAFHLALGVVSCLIVARLSLGVVTTSFVPRQAFQVVLRHGRYLPWLVWEIMLANLNVLGLVLSPRMHQRLDPHLLRFKSRLTTEYARTSLAQSITLTPGTITVRLQPDGEFLVHALDRRSGELEGIRSMEERVAHTFGQELEGE